MSEIINWCNTNEGFLSLALSVITLFISLYIMYKSNKTSKVIAKKQTEFEKEMSLRQEELQRRQIKVDTYPYRLDCWNKLYLLKEQTEVLKTAFQVVKFSELSFPEISRRLQSFENTYKECVLVLNQARSIFSADAWGKLELIKACAINNNNVIAKFKMYNEILTEDEKKDKDEEKEHDISQFSKGLNIISRELQDVLTSVEADMCISDLHTCKLLFDKGE